MTITGREMPEGEMQERERKLEEERDSLAGFLSERGTSMEALSRDIDGERLDIVLKGLTLMQLYLNAGLEEARKGNKSQAGYYKTRAEIMKEEIYGTVMEARRGLESIPSIGQGQASEPIASLRNYCTQKMDAGAKLISLCESNIIKGARGAG